MKAIAFLPAAAAAMLAFNISVASSQDVCVREFTACMNTCGLKPSKSMQDNCFAGCETKNGMCSERVFGKRPSGPDRRRSPTPAPGQGRDGAEGSAAGPRRAARCRAGAGRSRREARGCRAEEGSAAARSGPPLSLAFRFELTLRDRRLPGGGRDVERRLDRHGIAQASRCRDSPSSASCSISRSFSAGASLFTRDIDADLLKARRRRIGHHMAAHVEVGARHGLEAFVVDAHLRCIERKHRGVAADRAGQEIFQRRRRVGEAADVLRLADDELPAAVAGGDALVEVADRGDGDFKARLRAFGRATWKDRRGSAPRARR